MSVTLGGTDITGLVKLDDFGVGIEGAVDVANDGSIITYEREINYYKIDLSGGSDWGWLTLSIMQNLRALANVLGATYELDYEGVISTVRFRTEDIPVIFGESLIKKSSQANTDYYNNILIKLMEV